MKKYKLEATIKSVKGILSNQDMYYDVPDYQRPYSWDKENISLLIDDLITAFKTSNKEDYFCGSLVLVENTESKRYEIIDGQQRMTTFIIIACVFRDVFGESLSEKANDYINISIQDKYDETNRKLRFLTNEKYQIDFEQDILKGIDFTNKKDLNKYRENAHFVKEFLEEQIKDEDVNINDFVVWFYENVVLTTIICSSNDTAIQIFNVLNDRGMPLSPVDILKSHLMGKLGKEDRKSFKATWEEINSNLKFADLKIEDMLNAYLYYKLASNPKNKLHKELIEIFKKENIT